ncbi:MAG: hypothetical protein Q9184_006056 [Pyrenodesmia sp. 2 TL-2023]
MSTPTSTHQKASLSSARIFASDPYPNYEYNALVDHHGSMRLLRELLWRRETVPAAFYPNETWAQTLESLSRKVGGWVEELREMHEEFRRLYVRR